MGKLLDITNALFYTNEEKRELGEKLAKAARDRIKENRAQGKSLAPSTIRAKRRRGSPTPNTKLSDTEELKNNITYQVTKDGVKVGNTSKLHKLVKRVTRRRSLKGAKRQRIKNSSLAEINNEGKGVFTRAYLFLKGGKIFKEEQKIVLDFIDKRTKRILKDI